MPVGGGTVVARPEVSMLEGAFVAYEAGHKQAAVGLPLLGTGGIAGVEHVVLLVFDALLEIAADV
jgi:hypothetical protein